LKKVEERSAEPPAKVNPRDGLLAGEDKWCEDSVSGHIFRCAPTLHFIRLSTKIAIASDAPLSFDNTRTRHPEKRSRQTPPAAVPSINTP